MKITKKYIIPTMFVLGIIMVGLISTSSVFAQEEGRDSTPLAQKIAAKFNLNVSDVQAVFDEDRAEHKADMYAKLVERLDSMVSDGKITSDQKEAILKKHEEIENKMLELKNLSPEERKTQMDQYRSELESWAKEQGIVFPFFEMKGGDRRGGFMKSQ